MNKQTVDAAASGLTEFAVCQSFLIKIMTALRNPKKGKVLTTNRAVTHSCDTPSRNIGWAGAQKVTWML